MPTEGGDIGAGAFEFYEGIRIIVPGALTVALLAGFCATFGVQVNVLHENFFGAAVAAILVGLLFYYLDAPVNAAVYRVGLPTDVMEAWGVKPPGDIRVVNTYFVILDTDMPPGIRARTLYMGSIYRIGLEGIYLLGTFVIGALLTALWVRPAGLTQARLTVALDLSIIFVLMWLLVPLAFYLGRRRTLTGRRTQPERAAVNLTALQYYDLILCAAAVAFETLYLTLGHQWSAVCASAIAALWFGHLYFRGKEERKATESGDEQIKTAEHLPRRLPLSRSAATSTGVFAMSLPVASAIRMAASSGATTLVVVWAVGALISASLICARGHEKRLRAAYVTQSTWLEYNKQKMVEKYFVEAAESRQPELSAATTTAKRSTRPQKP